MNCRAFEPLIALYSGRDLEGRDAAGVEEHLAECSDCRQLLEDLQESRAALKELASEEVDAALLSSVRSGVQTGIGEPRRTLWPWVAGFAAAAALAIAVMPSRPAPQARPAPIAVQSPETVEPGPVPVKLQTPRHRRVKRQAPVVSSEPLVVKMLTDDPDVVIIWLVDKQGD